METESLLNDVREVLEELGLAGTRIIPALKEKWKDIDCITHSIGDVKERIKNVYGVELNDKEARFILKETLYGHDPKFGMTDDLFDIQYERYFTGEGASVYISELGYSPAERGYR